ncbi:MAG: flavin reductase family protein [Chloroflexi bacterium]|nr:flavin reductase family protein [Chloroflexota bacterium]
MADNPDGIAAALLTQPYGIFLVGTRDGEQRNLMTANWGTQCSFAPRLYSVFIEADSRTRKLIDGGKVFTVCFVPPDSEDVVSHFTRPAEVAGDKLGDHAFFDAPATGAPVYEGSVAWFECRVTESRAAGDHIQYIGEVVGGEVRTGDPAWTLQQLGWEYGG